ncbi:UvrABC system protein C [Desulfurobacterium thermolithotrophum DSM 11699]|uniref:UvrABC system protein C n=1 Tax=Desulfurobacterium thermolithotrophum (strain DSM 11699 / BSA) TaxID=868864 RepID=F0S3K0_DESTD|nr:excinuclease ABC subunit UvrC [Desulfurobacterium thermolithotrophum]ADY73422.1 UvrABC system protein C [Desulfurobacterium thermolithotrophum DSM 11699]
MREKLQTVPDAPGVYFFKDKSGKVIYVGKAKSLKNRLSTHINCTNPNEKSYKITKNAVDFDYIVVKNEKEALTLEAELIKKYLPKFNVLLKDDKSYPYLVLTDEEFPTVKIVRKKDCLKGKKFGPFVPPKNARNLKDLIHKVFKLRKCKELLNRSKPCLQYYIEMCTAPCCNYVSKKDYRKQVEGALSFLTGNVKNHINKLYSEIEKAAENLQFEKAAILRDQLIAIKDIYEKGSIFFENYPSCDVFYIERNNGIFSGVKLTVRNGILYGKENFQFDPLDPWDENLLLEFSNYRLEQIDESIVGTIWIKGTYEEENPPKEIFANFHYLGNEFSVKEIPEKVLQLVKKNRSIARTNLNLEKLKFEYESVFLDTFPERVEVFDNSSLQGTASVGACIVWEKGEFVKKDYRRYKIKNVKGINDYGFLEEVLTRRFKRIKKGEVKRPNLVLIDGGIGQLNVALKVRDSLGLDFRVFSIAKREEIVYTDDGEVVETKKYPYLFRFFTSLRDEAHRFAITFNRKLRNSLMVKSVLDDIKGIGTKRKKLLEKFYPDIKELAEASIEELVKIGIPRKVAKEVLEKIRDWSS